MKELTERFGQRVRSLRLGIGLTQEEFADRCNLDRTYISGIERGVRNVSIRNVGIIARALGVKIADLFAEDN